MKAILIIIVSVIASSGTPLNEYREIYFNNEEGCLNKRVELTELAVKQWEESGYRVTGSFGSCQYIESTARKLINH